MGEISFSIIYHVKSVVKPKGWQTDLHISMLIYIRIYKKNVNNKMSNNLFKIDSSIFFQSSSCILMSIITSLFKPKLCFILLLGYAFPKFIA